MLEWALRYVRLGWPVFPLVPRGKEPLIPASQGGHGCKDATLNESQVRAWWERWPEANIGIATGHGWFVVDADIKNGGDETWDMLRRQHGNPAETIEQETGTGGRHFLFLMPEGPPVRCSQNKIGAGLDVRGTGGYIVAEPSIHPDTGRAYRWDGLLELEQQKIAAAPAWVIKLIRDAEARPASAARPVPNTISEGGRNDTMFRLACRFRRSGLREEEIFASLIAINKSRCKPPLPENELRTIAGSASKYEPDRQDDAFKSRALSLPEIEAAIQAAIDRNDARAAGELAPAVAKMRKDVQALVVSKLRAHFGKQFPHAQFEAMGMAADEAELSQSDVEASVAAACELNDLKAAVELAPHVAKLPRDVQALITMRLRVHFGDRFPTEQFKVALRGPEKLRVITMPARDPDDYDDGPDLLGEPLTDSGNGERFVKMFGSQVRFCIEMEKWLVWEGKRWAIDDRKVVTQLAKKTARRLFEQAAGAREPIEKHARKSESAAGIQAMLTRAATEPGVAISASELDQHPYLLNCPNGVVDLRSGKILPHDRKFLITKLCPVEYDEAATCERFIQFIHWAMGDVNPDADPPERTLRLVSFLQRIFGYSLTGDVSEKCVFIFYGHTANNGKTTLVEVIKGLLGPDYSAMLNIKSLMTARGNDAGSDLADLRGVRFASASESQEGESLNEAQLKYITAGAGEIKARKLYENFMRFKQTHHLFIDTNHRPKVRGSDKGIWDRLKLIPFESRVDDAEIDRELLHKLLAEGPGILAWAVRGAMEWIEKKRLEEPIEVTAETQAWRESDDPLREFVEDCCELEKGHWEQCAGVSGAYVWWCKQNSERYPMGRSQLRERMLSKGFSENRSRRDAAGKQMRTYEGLRVKDEVREKMWASEGKFAGMLGE